MYELKEGEYWELQRLFDKIRFISLACINLHDNELTPGEIRGLGAILRDISKELDKIDWEEETPEGRVPSEG